MPAAPHIRKDDPAGQRLGQGGSQALTTMFGRPARFLSMMSSSLCLTAVCSATFSGCRSDIRASARCNRQDGTGNQRVGVLFEGAGTTQIGWARPLVLSPLGIPVELRQQQNRDLKVLGECQGTARGFPDVTLLIAVAAHRAELMRVVDDREARLDPFPHEALMRRSVVAATSAMLTLSASSIQRGRPRISARISATWAAASTDTRPRKMSAYGSGRRPVLVCLRFAGPNLEGRHFEAGIDAAEALLRYGIADLDAYAALAHARAPGEHRQGCRLKPAAYLVIELRQAGPRHRNGIALQNRFDPIQDAPSGLLGRRRGPLRSINDARSSSI